MLSDDVSEWIANMSGHEFEPEIKADVGEEQMEPERKRQRVDLDLHAVLEQADANLKAMLKIGAVPSEQDFELASRELPDLKVPLPGMSTIMFCKSILAPFETETKFKDAMRSHGPELKRVLEVLFDCGQTNPRIQGLLLDVWKVKVGSGLKKRFSTWGWHRREPVNEKLLIELVSHVAEEHRHTLGYRAVHSILKDRYGMKVSRIAVQLSLAGLFPAESEQRRHGTLKRREYNGPSRSTQGGFFRNYADCIVCPGCCCITGFNG